MNTIKFLPIWAVMMGVLLASCSLGSSTEAQQQVMLATPELVATQTLGAPTEAPSPVPTTLLSLTKTANPTTYSTAGQAVTYTYVITNSGTMALGPTQFTVTDAGINNNTPFNCGNADATLAPGATLTCSMSYTVTTADLSAASLSTQAIAAGGGAPSSQAVSATITKTESSSAGATSAATAQHTVQDGEWMWQIARCYGADPQQVVDANPSVNPTSIKPGTVITVPGVGSKGAVHAAPQPCVKKHLVQSSDTWASIGALYSADPGLTQMVNAYILTAGKEIKVPLYTQGLNIPVVSSAPTSQTSSGLTLTVAASPKTYSQAGQVITYTYTIKNSGSGSLGPAQFAVTDVLISAASINCGMAGTTLAPGSTTTCTASYTVTEADMSLGSITNSATASGGGAPASQPASDKVSRNMSALTLSISANPGNYNQVQQTVTINYVIKNSGNIPLGPAQFTVNDPRVGATPINCGAADLTLAPEATTTCNANYVITEQDMAVSSISVTVTSSGGGVTSQPASVTIPKQ